MSVKISTDQKDFRNRVHIYSIPFNEPRNPNFVLQRGFEIDDVAVIIISPDALEVFALGIQEAIKQKEEFMVCRYDSSS